MRFLSFYPKHSEVNGYENYLHDYFNLFNDFKLPSYDTIVDHFSLYGSGMTNRILESNCNFSSDTCTTSLFYVINGDKQLALRYHYLGEDSERVELYYANLKIAEMNYYKNYPSGYFVINYPDGRKKEEGYYKIDGFKTDTFTYVNAHALIYERQPYKHENSVKTGLWKFYNEGELIDEKEY